MADEHGARAEHVVDVLIARRIPEPGAFATREDEAQIPGQRVAAQGAARQQPFRGLEFLAFLVGQASLPTDGAADSGVRGGTGRD
jgi:hypothetical protein